MKNIQKNNINRNVGITRHSLNKNVVNIKIFEAFSGYGSQSLALERLKEQYPTFNYKTVGISEIDKYAIKSYNALHSNVINYGDISNINWENVPDFDLFTYSFPCTDISVAGEQKGLKEGSGTRSSLLWECRKIINLKRPKYLLMENVATLAGKKFMPFLKKWLEELEKYGYKSYVKIINAKGFGVPQNRSRLFVVSIYGKDSQYNYPQKFELQKTINDLLEKKVDEKYYIKESRIKEKFGDVNRFFCNYQPINGIIGISINPWCHKLEFDMNKSIKQIIPTLRATDYKGPIVVYGKDETKYWIRKLTPREYFRAMGLHEKEIDKIQMAGISNTQQYKLAGNSIVVNVLFYIFRNLFIDAIKEEKQFKLL